MSPQAKTAKKFSFREFISGIRIAAAIGLLLVPAGCSVGMAMSGQSDFDPAVIRQGDTKPHVRTLLGQPVRTENGENGGTVETYETVFGDPPSKARAFMHGTFDILTLGLWEVVGTPIEAVQGDTYEISVTFDDLDRVVAVHSPVKKEEPTQPQQEEVLCDFC